MANNPYLDLMGVMRSEGSKNNTPGVQIAIVVSDSPLVINVDDLLIDKNNLLVSENLLKHEIEFDSYLYDQRGGYINKLNIENNLKINDKLAVIPIENYQKYIILTKVCGI